MPKISQLTALTVPDSGDELPIVDSSASTTKKITRTNLLKGAPLPADTVDTQVIDDGSVTAPKINFGGAGVGIWWEEIGRTTLSSAGDTISVASLPARKHLKIIALYAGTGGTVNARLRFNNDSGNNYAYRYSVNNAADTTGTSQPQLILHDTTSSSGIYAQLEISNAATISKVLTGQIVSANTSAASTAPDKWESAGEWANLTDQITRIDLINSGGGDYISGSELIILGHD